MAHGEKLTWTFTADGNGTSYAWRGGKFVFFAYGSAFGSGTLKLQLSPDGTTWIDVASASKTANGYQASELPPCRLRAVLSGATNPVLTADVVGYV